MKINATLCLIAIAVLTACSNSNHADRVSADPLVAERDALAQQNNYVVSSMPYAKKKPLKSTAVSERWLQSKTFLLGKSITGAGSPMTEIIKAFGAIGINIVSTMPIENTYYYGPPITPGTTADTALQIMTQQMGLDYEVVTQFGSTPFVRLTEMGTLTYRLRVPDAVNGLSMVSPLTLSQAGDSQSGASGQTGSQGQGVNQATQMGQSGSGTNQGGNSSQGSAYTSYQNTFWQKLEDELNGLMRIVTPDQSAAGSQGNGSLQPGVDYVTDPNLPQAFVMPQQPFVSGSGATSGERKIGRVVVNSLTGNVSITAPRHIRQRIATYLDDLTEEMNTRITARARIVAVSKTEQESTGIDLAGFKSVAGDKYGFALTNNTLGEVKISDVSDGVRRVTSTDALSQSLIGVTRADKAFEAFFAYLQSNGVARTVNNLNTTTTSGVTAFIRKASSDPILRNSTSQVVTDGGNAVGGSSSTIEQNFTGSSLKVTPTYDPRRGLITALVDMEIILDSGEKPQTERLVAGDNIQANTIFLKKIDPMNIQNRLVARVGETIILGSFTTEQQIDTDSGITGLKDSFVGDLFGKTSKRSVLTDYFVLVSFDAHRYGEE